MISQRIKKILTYFKICSRRNLDHIIRDTTILIKESFAKKRMIVNIDSKNLNLKGNEPKNLVFKKKVILLNKPRKFIKTFLDDHN